MATLLSDPYSHFSTMDNAIWNSLCAGGESDLTTEEKLSYTNTNDNIVIENHAGITPIGPGAKNNILIGNFSPELTSSVGNNTVIGCSCRLAETDTNAVVIGNSAGGDGNCSKSVLLGLQAGSATGSNYESVTIGSTSAHSTTSNRNSVLVGFGIGGLPSTAVGGQYVPEVTDNAILIGNYAGSGLGLDVSNRCVFGNNVNTTVAGDARSPYEYQFCCGYGNGFFGYSGNPASITKDRFYEENSDGLSLYWPNPTSAFENVPLDPGVSNLVLRGTRVDDNLELDWVPQDSIQTLPYMLYTTAGDEALTDPVDVSFHRNGKVVTVYIPAMTTNSVTIGNLPYMSPTGTVPTFVDPIALNLQTGNASFYISAAGRAGIYGAFSLESFVSTPGRINFNLWELEGNPTSSASIWKSGFLDNANGNAGNASGLMFTYITA